jgi:hypothetical protein
MRRLMKHTTSLEDRIAKRLTQMKAEAEALPPGSIKRQRLERAIRQAETYARRTDWVGSAGLRSPA